MGDSATRRRDGGTASPPPGDSDVVSGSLAPVRASTSDLPRLEIDPRIDPGIGEVRDQIHDEADQGENVEGGKHHRIVAVEDAFEAEQAEPIERENGLDQERAGEEGPDEGAWEAGDHDQHGVAENVP